MTNKQKSEMWLGTSWALSLVGFVVLPNKWQPTTYVFLLTVITCTVVSIYHLHKYVTEPTNEKHN